MNNNTKIYLSKQGMKELKKKISTLENNQKKYEAQLRMGEMRDDSLARSELIARIEGLRSDIAEKKLQLENAKVLPASRGGRIKVALGSFVELIDEATGRMMQYQVVESIEANPSKGKISAESPLGRSLIGRKVDENVSWTAGLNNMQMQLVRIG